MITDLDRSYAAGLFDGEGSVSFVYAKASKNGKKYGRLLARVSQNDRSVLDWLKLTFGVGSVHQRKSGREGQHDFVVTHESARIFLAEIKSFLKLKGKAVEDKLTLDAITCKRRSKQKLHS